MAPSRAEYTILPCSSSDSFSHNDEFKYKPITRPQRLRRFRRCISRICRPRYIFVFLLLLLLWQVTFNVPYADSKAPKFDVDAQGNGEETVFIAANIVDADLITGAWGRALLDLVERIGKQRVFVSIYGGPAHALRHLESMLECESAIVSEAEDPLDLADIPRTTLPTGERRVKRIAFLAEVRNKALKPLSPGGKAAKGRKWDKVLFINDVHFEPEGALRLLWGTNVDEHTGKSEYKAVCAVDLVTSWKYYDTFATRDAEGYSIGVPIFPWFSAEGEAATRKDLLKGKDAVRVKSCWGGMVAFDGRYFLGSSMKEIGISSISAGKHGDASNNPDLKGVGVPELPLRFRSEPEPFWDSSECCLIHADIISLPPFPSASAAKVDKDGQEGTRDPYDTGIYMNPFVRVAYDPSSFKQIWLAKRFERAFALPQRIINYFAKMPKYNYRRTEQEGQVVSDKLWISMHSNLTEAQSIEAAQRLEFDENAERGLMERAKLGQVQGKEYWAEKGHYVDYKRTAKRGGYCGVRQLLVVKEGRLREGEGNWDNLLSVVPPVDV